MLAFIVQRLFQAIVVMFVVATLVGGQGLVVAILVSLTVAAIVGLTIETKVLEPVSSSAVSLTVGPGFIGGTF